MKLLTQIMILTLSLTAAAGAAGRRNPAASGRRHALRVGLRQSQGLYEGYCAAALQRGIRRHYLRALQRRERAAIAGRKCSVSPPRNSWITPMTSGSRSVHLTPINPAMGPLTPVEEQGLQHVKDNPTERFYAEENIAGNQSFVAIYGGCGECRGVCHMPQTATPGRHGTTSSSVT